MVPCVGDQPAHRSPRPARAAPRVSQTIRASTRVGAQRMPLGHLDQHDPQTVRVTDPHLVQAPRLPTRLAEHLDTPQYQLSSGVVEIVEELQENVREAAV